MQHQLQEEDEEELEEIDIDSIEDEQTLIQLLDEAEDFDDRKRIRDRLRKIQFEIKAQHEQRRQQRENEREEAIRKRLKDADEKKKKTMQMYNDMAKAGPGRKLQDDSRPESPVPGANARTKDLVEETIRQRVKAADDRKKRLLAAYDHAAKSQPAGQARIVEFDNFKRADVSKLETPKLPTGSCCFGMSGGIAKVEKVAPVAKPKPVDESDLDPMERAIRARLREAEERKKRTLAAYDMVAKSGGAGPKVVILEEFKDLDVSGKPAPKPRYDPCFRGGLKTQG